MMRAGGCAKRCYPEDSGGSKSTFRTGTRDLLGHCPLIKRPAGQLPFLPPRSVLSSANRDRFPRGWRGLSAYEMVKSRSSEGFLAHLNPWSGGRLPCSGCSPPNHGSRGLHRTGAPGALPELQPTLAGCSFVYRLLSHRSVRKLPGLSTADDSSFQDHTSWFNRPPSRVLFFKLSFVIVVEMRRFPPPSQANDNRDQL